LDLEPPGTERPRVVVAAEAAESRYALRAICLLAVLLAARAATLVLSDGQLLPSLRAFAAHTWQDVVVVLIFLAVDRAVRWAAAAWILYGLIALYSALNVPIAAVLSTPLTLTMVRAARGAIADSITRYVTAANLLGLVVPLVLAAWLPTALAARRRQAQAIWLLPVVATAALGSAATMRVEMRGLDRNALAALAASAFPRITPRAAAVDWRAPPFDALPADDLAFLRSRARGRHVIVVVLESTAARYLRLYGAAHDPTPALTLLASEALVFDRAYAVYPESVKGLFATLCSRHPAFDTAPEMYADVACTPIPAALRDAGYRTALFHSGRFEYLGMRAVVDNRGFEVLEDAGAIGGEIRSSFGVDEASTVRRLLAWIDGSDQRKPFFAMYLPIAGHHPYATVTDGPFDGDDDFTNYLNALHEADAAVGTLLRGLRARGLYDDTLIVVFGDHGEAFGQHQGNVAHSLFVYDENVRVPLLVALPGEIAATRRIRRTVSLVDAAPTILDLVGLPRPQSYEGASLLDPSPRLSLFFTDYSTGWLGLADSCWKYLYDVDADRSRLFDVCVDPDETRDRAAAFADRVRVYRERVRGWASAQKAALER
jgi:lipoteichoic acid synthase